MPNSHHLKFDIKIMKLANFIDQLGSDEKLFVRYRVPTFGDRSIRVDTREIHSKKVPLWNEYASFECYVSSNHIEQLELSSHVTFELRSRKSKQLFGGIMSRSRLLGGGKVSWKDVMGSKGIKLEKWINLGEKGGKLEGLKVPNLLVEMKVHVTRDAVPDGMKRCSSYDWVGSDVVDMYYVETIID